MNEIIDILMRRDGLSREEAIATIENCKEDLYTATTLEEAEESIAYWLSLEPDYLEILLP